MSRKAMENTNEMCSCPLGIELIQYGRRIGKRSIVVYSWIQIADDVLCFIEWVMVFCPIFLSYSIVLFVIMFVCQHLWPAEPKGAAGESLI